MNCLPWGLAVPLKPQFATHTGDTQNLSLTMSEIMESSEPSPVQRALVAFVAGTADTIYPFVDGHTASLVEETA